MKKKKIVIGFLVSSLFLAGGTILIDIGSVPLQAGIVSGIKSGVGKVAAKAKKLALEKLHIIKKVASALIKIAYQFGVKLKNVSYQTQKFNVTVPITMEKTVDGETESVEKNIGLSYDLGFEGAGDPRDGFRRVLGMMEPPMKIVPGLDAPLNLYQFLRVVQAYLSAFQKIGKKIPIIPTTIILAGMKKVVSALSIVSRLTPESIFMLKVFTLLHSALKPGDPVSFKNVPGELRVLLFRLMNSIHEPLTMLRNKLTNPEKIYTESGVKLVYMKSAPLKVQEILKKVPTPIKVVLNAMKIGISEVDYRTFQERSKQKKVSEAQKMYGQMRWLAGRGYNDATVFGLAKFLPLLDSQTLSLVDKELFVRAMVVQSARRFTGLWGTLNVKLSDLVGDKRDETVEDEEGSEKRSYELASGLATFKAVVKDRYPILILMLEKALAKMKTKDFSSGHIQIVEDLLTKVRSERDELMPSLQQITKPPKPIKEEKLDNFGVDEDLSDLDPVEAQELDDPFAGMGSGDEEVGAEEGEEAVEGKDESEGEEDSGEEEPDEEI